MSKYAGLIEYLASVPREKLEVRLSLPQIEGLIDGTLPASACEHYYWHGRGYRPHVDLLAEAGWSAHLNPRERAVTFRRESGARPRTRPSRPEKTVAVRPAAFGGYSERLGVLTQNLPEYVAAFTARQSNSDTAVFSRSQVRAHKKTLQRLHRVGLGTILSGEETEFFTLLHDTLDAWGMNQRAARLVSPHELRVNILDCADAILDLAPLRLCDLDAETVDDVARRLTGLMGKLQVSATSTRMVAFAKAVHHLLPNLLPPMDREYTLWFLLAPKKRMTNIDELFPDAFRMCARIAAANRDALPGLVTGFSDLDSQVMDTSETKLIDNGIVEYVRGTLGRRPPRN